MKPGMKKHGTENRKYNETGKHGKNTERTTLNRCPPITLKKSELCRSLMNPRVCYFVE
jgi:hypothetical protein